MGLFSFVKNAGQAVFGKDEPSEEQVSKDRLAAVLERKREKALADIVTTMGVPSADLKVEIEGDQVTVSGTTDSEENREKIILMLGNTQGVGRVDDRLEVSGGSAAAPAAAPAKAGVPAAAAAAPGASGTSAQPAPGGGKFHTVERGETLWKIAQAHYGKGNKYQAIFEANKPMLDNPDKIYPGQVLRIPPLS